MKCFAAFCIFFAIPFVSQGLLVNNTDSDPFSTPAIIARHGYPVEVHTVQTIDGYILTMHRIPYSRTTGNDGSKRQPAFIMHGFLDSSSAFVLLGPGKALAYILSEAGYDVWLGNARGNKYSRNHATENPSSKSFWNFGWHDIGMKDFPAMIDYILGWTGAQQVRYFGHSQGTTTFMVLNSIHPTFYTKIRSAHLLAPVAFLKHAESPLAKLSGLLLGQLNGLVELSGSAEFLPGSAGPLPDSKLMDTLGRLACAEQSLIQQLCGSILFFFGGWDSPYQNETLLPEILSTVPAGGSVNQLIHYGQLKVSGEFRQFDYGSLRNLIEYKQATPPNYDLSRIRVPTYLYYSDNDGLAALPDMERYIALMSNSSLKRAYKIPLPLFNHLDFLWGMGVENILYPEIMADLERS